MVPSTSPCTASIHPRIRLTLFTLAAILLPGAIVATGAEPTPLYR